MDKISIANVSLFVIVMTCLNIFRQLMKKTNKIVKKHNSRLVKSGFYMSNNETFYGIAVYTYILLIN